MTITKRTLARGALLTGAVLATGILALGIRIGMPFTSASESPVDPTLCVSTVLPDTYYQAIAEMNACTGSSVVVEIPPADLRWRVAGDYLPPGTGVSQTDP